MSSLAQVILSAAQSLPEGSVLVAREFLHLGARAAIDQALSRLARDGSLLRIGRGAYAVPVVGRFGPRLPSTQAVLQGMANASGETVVNHGATEANVLGLTCQVPVCEVFLTSGRSRTLQLGPRTVQLRHGRRWQMALGQRPAGMALRALDWLGPERAAGALDTLRRTLPPDEWLALRSARAMLPDWLARVVSANG